MACMVGCVMPVACISRSCAVYCVPFAFIKIQLCFAAGLGGTFTLGPHRSGLHSCLHWSNQHYKEPPKGFSASADTCAWWSGHHRSELVLQLVLQSCSCEHLSRAGCNFYHTQSLTAVTRELETSPSGAKHLFPENSHLPIVERHS